MHAPPQSDGETEAQSLSKVGLGALDLLSLETNNQKESSKVFKAATAARQNSVVTSGQVLLVTTRHGEGGGLRAGGASLIHELLAEAPSQGRLMAGWRERWVDS